MSRQPRRVSPRHNAPRSRTPAPGVVDLKRQPVALGEHPPVAPTSARSATGGLELEINRPRSAREIACTIATEQPQRYRPVEHELARIETSRRTDSRRPRWRSGPRSPRGRDGPTAPERSRRGARRRGRRPPFGSQPVLLGRHRLIGRSPSSPVGASKSFPWSLRMLPAADARAPSRVHPGRNPRRSEK